VREQCGACAACAPAQHCSPCPVSLAVAWRRARHPCARAALRVRLVGRPRRRHQGTHALLRVGFCALRMMHACATVLRCCSAARAYWHRHLRYASTSTCNALLSRTHAHRRARTATPCAARRRCCRRPCPWAAPSPTGPSTAPGAQRVCAAAARLTTHRSPRPRSRQHSTGQAEGRDSDCILRPVFSCPDPIRGGNNLLVLCEVMRSDATPHASNARAQLRAVLDAKVAAEAPLFGFEQEYSTRARARPVRVLARGHSRYLSAARARIAMIGKNGRVFGWPESGFPAPQGPFYCGTGLEEVYGRPLAEAHSASARVGTALACPCV
jgi:hypothetical protein